MSTFYNGDNSVCIVCHKLNQRQIKHANVTQQSRQHHHQTCSRSTSSASFMFFVWIRRISSRPVASGIPMSTSRSNRPAHTTHKPSDWVYYSNTNNTLFVWHVHLCSAMQLWQALCKPLSTRSSNKQPVTTCHIFRKVQWQHIQGVVKYLMIISLAIHWWISTETSLKINQA